MRRISSVPVVSAANPSQNNPACQGRRNFERTTDQTPIE